MIRRSAELVGSGDDVARRRSAAGGWPAAARTCLSTAALLLVGTTSQLHAQSSDGGNPYAEPADIAVGEESFRYHCAGCHGPNGKGGHAPDLTSHANLAGAEDAALFRTIRFGIGASEMRGTRFPDKRVWQLVSYVRSLTTAEEAQAPPGDGAKGKSLYRRAGCSNCHWIDGAGGRLGPELTGVGDRRTLKSLRTSLVEPDAEVDPAYWQLHLTAGDGTVVKGIKLHEDSFSIRLLDFNERLRSFEKGDLSEIKTVRSSMMASYGNLLSESDLNDLVSYLASLRR